MQALQAHRRDPLLIHRRMEHRRVMSRFTKGGFPQTTAVFIRSTILFATTRPETTESRVRPQPNSPWRIPMKMRSILGALVIASLSAMPALPVDMTPEEIKKLVDDAVNKKMQEHE